MEVKKVVLEAMEEVLGLEDIESNMNLNLLSEGLIDSLSIIYLITNIEDTLGIKLDLSQMTAADFSSVSNIIAAVENTLHNAK